MYKRQACGNDVASEREMCGRYILESVLYWAEEYHMDGFRFDLMGLLDVELINRIRKALDGRYGKGKILLYGEPWSATDTAMENGATVSYTHLVRACVCSEPYTAKLSKMHNNSNVLAFGARVVGSEMAKMITEEWLNAEYEGGRHQRRVDMLMEIENR